MERNLFKLKAIVFVLVSYHRCCNSHTQSQAQGTDASTSLGHELAILHITDTDTGQQNPPSNLGNELKITHDTENEDISLTNNLVTDSSANRPLDYYRKNLFSLNRMSRSQRRCCKRGSRAARKGMKCNLGYTMDGLQILNDYKPGFKLAVKMHPRDKNFLKKARKCFLKQENAQYYTRCCKEFGVIRSKRNN